MISRVLVLLVIPVIAFGVAACGGGGEAATTNSAATPAERYPEITAPRNDECIDKVEAIFAEADDSVVYSEEVASESITQWGKCEEALRGAAAQMRSVEWPSDAQSHANELAAAWEEEAALVAQLHKTSNRNELLGARMTMAAEWDAVQARGRKASQALREKLGLPSADGSQDPVAASTSSTPSQDGTTTKQADPLPDETDAATGSASEANPCQDELDMLNRYSRSTHPQEKADSQWVYRNCLHQNGKGPDPGPLPG